MKLSNDKMINYALMVVGGLILLFLIYKFAIKPIRDRRAQETSAASENVNTPASTGTTVTPSALTNSSLLEWKSPLMSGDRVKWVQYEYNRYAKQRKLFGKTPDWPTISEDGKFGEGTHKAMNRLMGKYKVTYAEVKSRVDYLIGQLAVEGLGTPSSTSEYDPYGWNGNFN